MPVPTHPTTLVVHCGVGAIEPKLQMPSFRQPTIATTRALWVLIVKNIGSFDQCGRLREYNIPDVLWCCLYLQPTLFLVV